MLVKKLLICSSPPNGDNKTLLSAVFIFSLPLHGFHFQNKCK